MSVTIQVLPGGRAVAFRLDPVETVLQGTDEDLTAVVCRYFGLLNQADGRHQGLNGATVISWRGHMIALDILLPLSHGLKDIRFVVECVLPALASDTALDMALEEIALFLFMISSNSASLSGVRDASISLQIQKKTRNG